MKKIKSGFSLAEILITLGIISVVATLGFSVARQNIARAYDYYLYNAYQSIAVALEEAKINLDNPMGNVNVNGINEPHIQRISNLLSGIELRIDPRYGAGPTFRTPNGVEYRISTRGTYQLNGENVLYHNVVIYVPAEKHFDELANAYVTKRRYQFLYIPEFFNLLIPWENGATPWVNELNERMDLLPFYIDDGIVGRVLLNNDGTTSFRRPTYRTFRDAFCRCLGDELGDLPPDVRGYCQGFVAAGAEEGVVKLADPRKI